MASAFTRVFVKLCDFVTFKGFSRQIPREQVLLRKSETPRKSPEKRTFLSLAFYNAPSLHSVDHLPGGKNLSLSNPNLTLSWCCYHCDMNHGMCFLIGQSNRKGLRFNCLWFKRNQICIEGSCADGHLHRQFDPPFPTNSSFIIPKTAFSVSPACKKKQQPLD